MISLLLGILVICTIVFLSVGLEILAAFIILFDFFLFVTVCFLWYSVANDGELLPQKIAMYEEENARLEEQLAVAVNSYIQHESTTYEKILSKNSINIALTLPVLQSNEIIQQQIKIYMNNAQQIKELKNELIELRNKRWLLYFGK